MSALYFTMLEGNIDTDLALNLTDEFADRRNDSNDSNGKKELIIAVHIISNLSGCWSKSRRKVTFTIKDDDFRVYGDDGACDDVTIETSKVCIVDVHSAIIRSFGQEALLTLSAIRAESNITTESTLTGDNHAKFNERKKLALLITDLA